MEIYVHEVGKVVTPNGATFKSRIAAIGETQLQWLEKILEGDDRVKFHRMNPRVVAELIEEYHQVWSNITNQQIKLVSDPIKKPITN